MFKQPFSLAIVCVYISKIKEIIIVNLLDNCESVVLVIIFYNVILFYVRALSLQ